MYASPVSRIDVSHVEIGGEHVGEHVAVRLTTFRGSVLDHDARELLAQLDHLQ